ncbi:hypothetical protein B0J12DRAFT_679028 [Macrophomina phaseolina]|uniref:Uncharacterized protein n=1 Tax=Macrophomina phaseolina TaxID=35725 RepID=A0ABQ8G0E7_9PEZI|nr:hypothetical protein B0J12DRAFT_679028 [Macrophomina phaseolina]
MSLRRSTRTRRPSSMSATPVTSNTSAADLTLMPKRRSARIQARTRSRSAGAASPPLAYFSNDAIDEDEDDEDDPSDSPYPNSSLEPSYYPSERSSRHSRPSSRSPSARIANRGSSQNPAKWRQPHVDEEDVEEEDDLDSLRAPPPQPSSVSRSRGGSTPNRIADSAEQLLALNDLDPGYFPSSSAPGHRRTTPEHDRPLTGEDIEFTDSADDSDEIPAVAEREPTPEYDRPLTGDDLEFSGSECERQDDADIITRPPTSGGGGGGASGRTPARAGLLDLPPNLVDMPIRRTIGLCTLRRNSAEIIRRLPRDPRRRYSAVMALRVVANDVPPAQQGVDAISASDRRKYQRFREQLDGQLAGAHVQARAEEYWLRNFPLDLLQLDRFTRRPDPSVTHLAVALHARDALAHDWDALASLLHRLDPRGGVQPDAPRAGPTIGLNTRAAARLVPRIPATVRSVRVVASYRRFPLWGPPPLLTWRDAFALYQSARDGYKPADADAVEFHRQLLMRWPNATIDPIEGLAAEEVTEDDYDTWAWI